MGHYVSLINGMSNAQADDFMSFATDLLDGNSGIVASGDYAVAQSSPVAMSVTVATGKAYIYISSLLSYYRTILDAAATLSIASNSSGSTRIDLICIKIDTGATPDANASNVASVVVVQGTPGGGAPATPANHYKLAEVTVASGAASIANANIADSRVQLNIRTGTKVGGVTPGAATDAGITFSDVTTNNASTSKHGFLKKLSNVTTQFMNGVGNWVDGILSDGWSSANEAWTYASASTINVPSGAAAKYSIGDSIRWKQGGAYKYGVLSAVADTLLTIIVNTDFTVANADITDNYFTHSPTAIGLPAYYNFTPSWANITVGAGANVGKYKTTGRFIELAANWTFGAGAAVGIDAKLNFPVTQQLVYAYFGWASYVDASATAVYGFLRNDGYLKYFAVAGTQIGQSYLQATSPFTWTTNDQILVEAAFHF